RRAQQLRPLPKLLHERPSRQPQPRRSRGDTLHGRSPRHGVERSGWRKLDTERRGRLLRGEGVLLAVVPRARRRDRHRDLPAGPTAEVSARRKSSPGLTKTRRSINFPPPEGPAGTLAVTLASKSHGEERHHRQA